MRASSRQAVLIAALALLGIVAWWFGQRSRTAAPPAETAQSRRPDYVVEGLRALDLDLHGQPARQLSAKQLRHYPDDDSSELEQPQVRLFDEHTPPWIILAARGHISSRAEQIILSGGVRAERAAAPGSEAIAFRTSEIAIFPDDHYAETDRFVEMETGAHRLTAVNGMRIWYAEPKRGRLLGRVRIQVAPSGSAGDLFQQQEQPEMSVASP